jgi:hypothetical protein
MTGAGSWTAVFLGTKQAMRAARAPSEVSVGKDKTTTVQGTVRKLGLEGGLWALVTDGGEQWELLDAPDELKTNGLRAEVEVSRRGADVTIGMVGHAGTVKRWSKL